MSIRQWKEKEPNLNCSISSIVNNCGQKYCQKIAKAYYLAIGFGDFRLEGVVLRKKASLPIKREEMLFVSDCRLVSLSSFYYTAESGNNQVNSVVYSLILPIRIVYNNKERWYGYG